MKYIVLDLEATCEENNPNFDMEIIEIGALLINEKKEIVRAFDSFVKPVVNPILSNFCKSLTTIQQEDVDNARSFIDVINEFVAWGRLWEGPYTLCSWGFYDAKQLKKDCKRHGIETSWLNPHRSIKHEFAKLIKHKPCGMKAALNILGIPHEGTHHRGIDDAKNITKIFLAKFDELEAIR